MVVLIITIQEINLIFLNYNYRLMKNSNGNESFKKDNKREKGRLARSDDVGNRRSSTGIATAGPGRAGSETVLPGRESVGRAALYYKVAPREGAAHGHRRSSDSLGSCVLERDVAAAYGDRQRAGASRAGRGRRSRGCVRG